jgi:hypothetical protein
VRGDPGSGRPARCVTKTDHDKCRGPFSLIFPSSTELTYLNNPTSEFKRHDNGNETTTITTSSNDQDGGEEGDDGSSKDARTRTTTAARTRTTTAARMTTTTAARTRTTTAARMTTTTAARTRTTTAARMTTTTAAKSTTTTAAKSTSGEDNSDNSGEDNSDNSGEDDNDNNGGEFRKPATTTTPRRRWVLSNPQQRPTTGTTHRGHFPPIDHTLLIENTYHPTRMQGGRADNNRAEPDGSAPLFSLLFMYLSTYPRRVLPWETINPFNITPMSDSPTFEHAVTAFFNRLILEIRDKIVGGQMKRHPKPANAIHPFLPPPTAGKG